LSTIFTSSKDNEGIESKIPEIKSADLLFYWQLLYKAFLQPQKDIPTNFLSQLRLID
jgi:hypothetical protein